MNDHLLFDASNAVSDADTHNVGAYVRAGKSSALITHHALFKAAASPFNFVDGDVTPASDSINEASHGYRTGDLVRLTTTGTLPAGLATSTDYFVIRVDANNIKLASSRFNAEWGIAVDITAAAGGGTHTVTGIVEEAKHLDVFAAMADGEGNKLTSTGGSLNVNMTNSPTFDVDLDGVYSGGNTDPDNVGLIAHVRAATPGDTDQTFRSTGAKPNADALDPANISALDVNSFLMGWNGSAWDRVNLTSGDLNINDGGNVISIDDAGGSITVDGTVSISGTVAVTQSTSPWVVSATDLDIRDLTHLAGKDSVRLGDGTNFITSTTVGSDIGLDVYALNDPSTANGSIATAAETLDAANTAQNIIASPLANRKTVFIYNKDNQAVFIGQSGVTAADGFPIAPGSYMELKAGSAVDIEFVSSKLNHEIRTLELS